MEKQEQVIYNLDEEDRTINLSSLLAALLRSWKQVLICGIIFCLLGTAFQAYRSRMDEKSQKKAAAIYERQLENYESAKESYERERDAVQADIDDIYKYIDQSILLKINPYKEAYATADILIDVEEDASSVILGKELSVRNDEAGRVLGAYISFLENSISYEEIAAEYGVEQRYIRELVKTEEVPENGSLQIYVRHTDLDAAEKILDYVLAKLEEQKATYTDEMMRHTYTVVNKAVRWKVDNTLATTVDEQRSGATVYRFLNSQYSKQLNKVDEYNARISTINEKIGALTIPVSVEQSLQKDILKYALVGFAGGIVLALVLLALRLILGGKLTDRLPLLSQFRLRLLAAFPYGSKSFLNRMADRVLSAETGLSEDEVQTVAVNSIHRWTEKEKNTILIAIGSEFKESTFRTLINGLQEKDSQNTYVAVPSFGNNLHTQQALEACDGVVLLAKIAKTRQTTIGNILNMTEQYDKPALGVILYN